VVTAVRASVVDLAMVSWYQPQDQGTRHRNDDETGQAGRVPARLALTNSLVPSPRISQSAAGEHEQVLDAHNAAISEGISVEVGRPLTRLKVSTPERHQREGPLPGRTRRSGSTSSG
jgi:hypothetical protein